MDISTINCSTKSLKQFIYEGGNVNEVIPDRNKKLPYYQNLLIQALRREKSSFVFFEHLVQAGIDVNFIDYYGNNALFYTKNIKIAQLLIDNGCDVLHLNKENESAIRNNNIPPEVIRLYCEKGINIHNPIIDPFLGKVDYFIHIQELLFEQYFKEKFLIGIEYFKDTYPDISVERAFEKFNKISPELITPVIEIIKGRQDNFAIGFYEKILLPQFGDLMASMEKDQLASALPLNIAEKKLQDRF